jgi:hypothetical protein
VHCSDKFDLLMSDTEEFFKAISTSLSTKGDNSQRVAPAQEFFAHVRDMHQFFDALVASGSFYENFELARGHFARGSGGLVRCFPCLPGGLIMVHERRLSRWMNFFIELFGAA